MESLLRSPVLMVALSALLNHQASVGGGVQCGLGLCSLSCPMLVRILGTHAGAGGVVVACGHGLCSLKSFLGLRADASVAAECGHGSCHRGYGS